MQPVHNMNTLDVLTLYSSYIYGAEYILPTLIYGTVGLLPVLPRWE